MTGFANAQIKEKSNGQYLNAGERDFYYPVSYLNPEGIDEGIIAYDLGSEQNIAKELLVAERTGELAITDPVMLNNQQALLFILPRVTMNRG